jgi:hypothetical protein
MGLNALRSGNTTTAEHFFLKALERNPNFTEAWCDLAQTRLEAQQLTGALAAIEAAIETDSLHTRARVLRRRIMAKAEPKDMPQQSYRAPTHQDDIDVENLFNLIASYGPDGATAKANMPIAAKRKFFIDELSSSIPSRDAIHAILVFTQQEAILEVGAGKGLWASLIQKLGGTVIATDLISKDNPSQRSLRHQSRPAFTFVERIAPIEAILKYPNCATIMMCWPPFDSPIAERVLAKFEGERFIFIGESHLDTERSGDQLTFRERIEQDWVLEKQVNIDTWPGVYDSMFFYRRKCL